MLALGLQFFHFIALVCLIYFLVIRKQFPQFVKNRHETFKETYARIQKELKEAQIRYTEYDSRLKAIGTEIGAIRNQVKEEAEASRLKILTDGKRLAGVIVSDAKINTHSMAEDLKQSLKVELVEAVMQKSIASIKSKLTQDDQKRIRMGFSDHLKRLS